jgi:hypothetical protein
MSTLNRGAKKGRYPSPGRIEKAGHELKEDPPAVLAKTKRKFGKARADRQRIAIMLNKARREDV